MNWDPSVIDHVITDNNQWMQGINVPRLDHPFNDYGECIHWEFTGINEEYDGIEALVYDTTDLNAQDKFNHNKPILSQDIGLFDDNGEDDYEIIKYCGNTVVRFNDNTMISINTSQWRLPQGKHKYKQLRPCFLHNNKEVIKRTLEATTQFGRSLLAGKLQRNTYRSPFPANNAVQKNKVIATDSVKASIPAIDTGGVKQAQFYIGRT